MSATTPTAPSNAPKIGAFIGALMIVFALVISITASRAVMGPQATALTEPSPTTTTSAPATPVDAAACEPQYVQVAGNNEGNRVIGNFGDRYAAATAEANNLSDAQRGILIEEAGKNAQVLATWAHAFNLFEDPNAWQSLADGSCLSSEGLRVHAQLEGALNAKGTTFEEAEAPANGFNSGISNGAYGVASEAGIYGDRKAIKVTLPDGTVVYIMVRCGNPVYSGNPGLPMVPTDNPPPPAPPAPPADNPPPPPDNPPPGNPPSAKKPLEDPYPQGNAPVGGGNNADPGPGTSVPPQQMEQPPSKPRENPAPPPPAPPAAPAPGPAPAPVPQPDPAPAPPPEPAAPAPSAPETGCIAIPGVMDC